MLAVACLLAIPTHLLLPAMAATQFSADCGPWGLRPLYHGHQRLSAEESTYSITPRVNPLTPA